jgi:hypothetical protein
MHRQRGQTATEFALLCVVLAGALWLPWNGDEPVALQWFTAWAEWRTGILSWLADG